MLLTKLDVDIAYLKIKNIRNIKTGKGVGHDQTTQEMLKSRYGTRKKKDADKNMTE